MLTEYNGFKLGDRVYWPGGEGFGIADLGTISKVDDEVFFEDECGWNVWVKWDFDGEYNHIDVNSIQHKHPKQNNPLTNEQEAAMFLISLGYTVSKNQK